MEISPACCGEIYWPEGEDEPQKDCIHVVLQREIRHWMWEDEDFDYETFGRYALLITDERGNLTTDESFQCVEEAYYSLVRHLETLKSFQ